jgi:formate dehydrogenase major subunit
VTERIQPGVVYTTFHFPESGANVITTDSSDWATNCPEYKVTAVQVMPVAQPSEWQQSYSRFNREQLGLLDAAQAHTSRITMKDGRAIFRPPARAAWPVSGLRRGAAL